MTPANKIWNPSRECLTRQALADLQLDELREQLHRVWKSVPYYAAKMKQAGLTPDSIRSLDDVRRLPFIATREGALDNLEVKVEMSEALFTDQMRKLNAVKDELQHKIDASLGVHTKLTLVEPGSLERFMGKAKRVEDHRTF